MMNGHLSISFVEFWDFGFLRDSGCRAVSGLRLRFKIKGINGW